jgi:hypothetical protein
MPPIPASHLCAILLPMLSAGTLAYGDEPGIAPAANTEVYAAKIESKNVDAHIFIPGDTKVLRGVLLHSAHYNIRADDRWAEMCRTMGWAHLALSVEGNQRVQRLSEGIDLALKVFADQSGHTELLNLPITCVGHSAGGQGMLALLSYPKRLLTDCISCGWISSAGKLGPCAEVPYLCVLGAIPDDFKMLPDVEANFLPARAAGLPWGLALQWGCAHDFGNCSALFVPWIQGVNAFRVPASWDPLSGPVPLKPMKESDGWLGDRASVEGNFATVTSFAEYHGDKALASWFPSRASALVWRAFVSKDSPLILEAAASDASTSLPPLKPNGERGMMVNPGRDVTLRVRFSKPMDRPMAIQQIEYFDGDVSLGTTKAEPWNLEWKNPPQGAHPVYAVWTMADGSQGTTSPALICCPKYEPAPAPSPAKP